MKKELISFALLGLVVNFQNSSGSVETNINTKVKDGKVEIKNSIR